MESARNIRVITVLMPSLRPRAHAPAAAGGTFSAMRSAIFLTSKGAGEARLLPRADDCGGAGSTSSAASVARRKAQLRWCLLAAHAEKNACRSPAQEKRSEVIEGRKGWCVWGGGDGRGRRVDAPVASRGHGAWTAKYRCGRALCAMVVVVRHE